MESSGLEPEQLEREFPGWVAWTTVRRIWYARYLKSPSANLSGESGEELRRKLQAWQDGSERAE